MFPGNHDLWVSDYLVKECGVTLIREAHEFMVEGKRFYVHHGDGLGPGDFSYKILKKIFKQSSSSPASAIQFSGGRRLLYVIEAAKFIV